MKAQEIMELSHVVLRSSFLILLVVHLSHNSCDYRTPTQVRVPSTCGALHHRSRNDVVDHAAGFDAG